MQTNTQATNEEQSILGSNIEERAHLISTPARAIKNHQVLCVRKVDALHIQPHASAIHDNDKVSSQKTIDVHGAPQHALGLSIRDPIPRVHFVHVLAARKQLTHHARLAALLQSAVTSFSP